MRKYFAFGGGRGKYGLKSAPKAFARLEPWLTLVQVYSEHNNNNIECEIRWTCPVIFSKYLAKSCCKILMSGESLQMSDEAQNIFVYTEIYSLALALASLGAKEERED